MLIFPQLLSGAVAQYPLGKRYSISNITNIQEDGFRYGTDATDFRLNWGLRFSGLTSVEANQLVDFFKIARGRLEPFVFLDPMANLLKWSEDLSKPVWLKTARTSVTSTSSNKVTIHQIHSDAADGGGISQSLPCGATAMVCLSLKARADEPTQIELAVSDASGEANTAIELNSEWHQVMVTQQGSGDDSEKLIRISLPKGGAAELTVIHVSAQPYPAPYDATRGQSGIMPSARFDQDDLVIVASGNNNYSCEVRITTRR